MPFSAALAPMDYWRNQGWAIATSTAPRATSSAGSSMVETYDSPAASQAVDAALSTTFRLDELD